MPNPVESLGIALRYARKKQKLTQQGLANELHMSNRTVINAENGTSNPKFETVALLAKRLNVSIDAVLYPASADISLSKTVVDFFAGKSEEEIETYISLCQQIEAFRSGKQR